MDRAQARVMWAQVAKGLRDIDELYRALAWRVAGYESWPAACHAELGRVIPVDAALRREVVDVLRSEGMTQQAIADALGVGEATVARDVAGLLHVEETGHRHPDTVVGKDGRERPARKGTNPRRDELRQRVADYMQEHPTASQRQCAKALGVGDRRAISEIGRELGIATWVSARPAHTGLGQRLQQYLREHPGASGREASRALDVDAAAIYNAANKIGHRFVQQIEPVTQIPPEVGALARVHGNVGTMEERNGRRILARYLYDATEPGDLAYIQQRREDLAHDVAYLADMLRILDDEDYRMELVNGHGGRDDITQQQVKPRPLRAV